MIESLIVAACYLTFYAKVGGTAAQVGALALLFAAASYAVLLNKIKPIPVSLTELVMYGAGVVSVILGLISGEEGVGSSIAFLIAIVLFSILSRVLSLSRLMDVGAWVTLACVLTCIVFDRSEVVQALSISVGRNGLMRFMPLENHPDLTGFIFGSGSILLVRRTFITKSRLERLAVGLGTLLSWLFILAASARSSIIALLAASSVALFFEFRGSRFMTFKYISLTLTSCAVIGALFFEKISKYVTGMLELDSSARGVSSGGSGRMELWVRGVATLFDDPMTLAFGGGFRSSSSELIGFSTESSYITILLDSGLFIGSAIIFLYWYAPIRALRLTPARSRHTSEVVLLPCFLVFVIVESIFNRYLLAIGNPASLITLMLLVSLSLRKNWLASPAVVPLTWKAPVMSPADAKVGMDVDRPTV
jgi:exopolysaccharide production protein ExoQ